MPSHQGITPLMRAAAETTDGHVGCVRSLLEHFLAVEKFYPDDRSELLGVYNLHTANEGSPGVVLQGVLSHFQIERKVK